MNMHLQIEATVLFDQKLVQVSLEMSTPVSGWCRKDLMIHSGKTADSCWSINDLSVDP